MCRCRGRRGQGRPRPEGRREGTGRRPGPAFEGRVEEVRLTPINEHGAVFYRALVGVRNERDAATHEWRLRPGMTADVDVLLRVHDPVWKVPAAALTFQLDPVAQTEAAKAKLGAGRRERPRRWRPVWATAPTASRGRSSCAPADATPRRSRSTNGGIFRSAGVGFRNPPLEPGGHKRPIPRSSSRRRRQNRRGL